MEMNHYSMEEIMLIVSELAWKYTGCDHTSVTAAGSEGREGSKPNKADNIPKTTSRTNSIIIFHPTNLHIYVLRR